MVKNTKCEKCLILNDCEKHTQSFENNFMGGQFLPLKIRNLCSGSEQDQHAIYISCWYLHYVYYSSMSGASCSMLKHINNFQEIDFKTEIPKLCEYLKPKDTKFKKEIINNMIYITSILKLLQNSDFEIKNLSRLKLDIYNKRQK